MCHNLGSLAREEQWPMWRARLALIVDHLVTCTMSAQSGVSIQKAFIGKVPVRLLVWEAKFVKQGRMLERSWSHELDHVAL